MNRIRQWLRLWFSFDIRVGRREYLNSGLVLGLLKYAGDVLLVYLGTGRFWSPWDYVSPVHSLLAVKLASATHALYAALLLWALPFLWIGISMSVRRALDARISAWTSLLFFIPGVNYVFMGVMSLLPSREPASPPAETPRGHEQRLAGAVLSIAAGVITGLGMLAIGVYLLKSYGVALFLGTPFVIGLLSAYLFNRRYESSSGETQSLVAITMVCVGATVLLSATEGAICLLMVLPLALVIGAMGASMGRRFALMRSSTAIVPMIAVVGLPFSAVLETSWSTPSLREVRSEIVIAAAPDVVWKNVIAFSALPEPSDLLFRAGIAYPQRAEILGEGVGAVRHCVFSTGAFVEPITRWEPGRRLSFDVVQQPPPLHEWSPYANITPPHLAGYFQSRRGEFRLVALPDGRTRLEGSTWYEMRVYPESYWTLFGDAFIKRIHGRVLRHIRTLAERQT